MTKQNQLVLEPMPLPETNKALVLKTSSNSLNDRVKNALMNGAYPAVKPFLDAVQNSTAVQGSVAMDRAAAAKALQEYNLKNGNDSEIAKANWARLDRAIGVATRSMLLDGKPIDRNSRLREAKLAAIAHQSPPHQAT